MVEAAANNKAAAMCDGKCEIKISNAGSCTEAAENYEFRGSCCALEERGSECYMVTTEDCYYIERGTDGMNCMGEGENRWCLPAYTLWYSTSDEACPETQFPLDPPGAATAATNKKLNNKAAASCEGKCEIKISNAESCTDAVQKYEFHGSCCALEENEDGECIMVTTEDCYYIERGTDGMRCSEEEGEETWCLPAYTIFFSTSDEACPATQFPLDPPATVAVATNNNKAKETETDDTRTANRFGVAGGAPPPGFFRGNSNQLSLRLQSNLKLLYETGTGSAPSSAAVTVFQEVTGSFFNALFQSTSDPVFAGKNARFSMENVETTYVTDELHAKFTSHVEMTDTDGTAATSSPADIQRLMTDRHLLQQYLGSLMTASSEFNGLHKVIIRVIRHGTVRRR